MSSKQAQKAIKVYGNLLGMIKARLSLVDDAVDGKIPLPPKIVEEFSYLQLRMACESIALGCLTIHGDMLSDKLKNIQGAYEGGKIISHLEKLHSDFYPIPFTEQIQPSGLKHLGEITQPYLTKNDLKKLIGICGDKLHMGSISKLLKDNKEDNSLLLDIRVWSDKIHHLINRHQFRLFDKKTIYVCKMVGGLYGYKAEIILAESYHKYHPSI